MITALLILVGALFATSVYGAYKVFYSNNRSDATLAREWERLHEADIREAADIDPAVYFRRGLERLRR